MIYKVGDKVCLAIDKNTVGIIIAVLPSVNSVSRYQVFHNAANITTYFENQLLPMIDVTIAQMTPLQEFWGLYAAHKMRINSSSTMFALNAGKIKFMSYKGTMSTGESLYVP